MTSLKTIKLRLPAHFHEIDVARIGEGFECPPFNSLAFNAYRDDNHNATPWSVEWMFDGTQADAALEPLRRHVIAAAAIYNLNLPDTLDFDVIAVPNRD